MLLSELRVNEVGIFLENFESRKIKGKTFIVKDRWPEDRGSGGTVVIVKDEGEIEIWWERYDPKVFFKSKGNITTVIDWGG